MKPGEGKEYWVEGTKWRSSSWGIKPWGLIYPRRLKTLVYCRSTVGPMDGMNG